MKICWNNLENIKLTTYGNFRDIKTGNTYVYVDACEECKESYLTLSYKKGKFCSHECQTKGRNNPMYGKRHSEITRRNIRRNRSNISGRNNPMYGKRHSEITKNKISTSMIGKYEGENNSNWKGGISCEPYCEQWQDKEYKESIKERDGYKCLNPYCSKTINRLCIHHIDYNKKNCHPSNLITLCISCNIRANKDRRWHKSWYKAIINKREFINGN